MAGHDPRIDAYIAKSAPFAQPILTTLRERVHAACPDVEETIKWGMPTFVYGGGILCGMAAFKQHASFGFWKHALVIGEGPATEGMGSIGKLTTVAQLPPKARMTGWIRKAMRLNEDGVKLPGARKSAAPKPVPDTPNDLAAALAMRKHAKARRMFDAFAPSHRREYVEWIVDAKRDDTRARRLAQTLEWLAEGKPRNWKYGAK
jgi:uncharacterized protein YdeI (YjbR/CyaY-like superfamily)